MRCAMRYLNTTLRHDVASNTDIDYQFLESCDNSLKRVMNYNDWIYLTSIFLKELTMRSEEDYDILCEKNFFGNEISYISPELVFSCQFNLSDKDVSGSAVDNKCWKVNYKDYLRFNKRSPQMLNCD